MDKEIVEIAKRYVRQVETHLPFEMAVLYGSYARGTAVKTSDIDIAIVVNKLQGDYLKVSADLFNLVRSVNKKIEPVLLVKNNDRGGFLESILKYGKIIYKKNRLKSSHAPTT